MNIGSVVNVVSKFEDSSSTIIFDKARGLERPIFTFSEKRLSDVLRTILARSLDVLGPLKSISGIVNAMYREKIEKSNDQVSASDMRNS